MGKRIESIDNQCISDSIMNGRLAVRVIGTGVWVWAPRHTAPQPHAPNAPRLQTHGPRTNCQAWECWGHFDASYRSQETSHQRKRRLSRSRCSIARTIELRNGRGRWVVLVGVGLEGFWARWGGTSFWSEARSSFLSPGRWVMRVFQLL